MALIANTQDPSVLLVAIKKAIDDNEIDTWSYDKDGDFTHTPSQWKNLAWLRPVIDSGTLKFGIIGHKDIALSKTTYSVYHGRFIEMLLTHFASKVPSVGVTGKPVSKVDLVSDLA
jgi:hypothetical protein